MYQIKRCKICNQELHIHHKNNRQHIKNRCSHIKRESYTSTQLEKKIK